MSFRLEHGGHRLDLVEVPIADAVAVSKGDPINFAAGTATVFTSQTDNSTFLGIAHSSKGANDGQTTISVDISSTSVYRCALTSDSYALGAPLRMAATAGELVDPVVASEDAQMIAFSREQLAAASTEGLVSFISRIKVDAIGV